MRATLSSKQRQGKSFHSKRVWVASALADLKSSDGEVQALCRWSSVEPLRAYARMNLHYQARWRHALLSADVQSLHATQRPTPASLAAAYDIYEPPAVDCIVEVGELMTAFWSSAEMLNSGTLRLNTPWDKCLFDVGNLRALERFHTSDGDSRLHEVQARNALDNLRTSSEAADWADDIHGAAFERRWVTAREAAAAHDRARHDDWATARLAAILEARSRLPPPPTHITPPPSPSPAPPPPQPILRLPSPPRYGAPFGTAHRPSRQLAAALPGSRLAKRFKGTTEPSPPTSPILGTAVVPACRRVHNNNRDGHWSPALPAPQPVGGRVPNIDRDGHWAAHNWGNAKQFHLPNCCDLFADAGFADQCVLVVASTSGSLQHASAWCEKGHPVTAHSTLCTISIMCLQWHKRW